MGENIIQIPLLAGHLRSASKTPFKWHFAAVSIMAKIESWLGSFTILRGSGSVLLKNYICVFFEGGGGGVQTPDPPPDSHMHYILL